MESKDLENKIVKKTGNWVFLFMLFFVITSCKNNPKLECKDKYNTEIVQLKKSVVNGDTLSYVKLSKILFSEDRIPELYVYSLIMGNHYNYPIAYYDVYLCLIDAFDNDINTMNIELKEFSIMQLKKGSQLNCEKCIHELDSLGL